MAEIFMGVDCSTESGLMKALKNRQAYQMQENLSNVDTTSVQDEYVDTCESDNVEQEPTSVNTAMVIPSGTTLPDITVLTDEELAELITGSLNFDCADYCDSFTQGCAFNCGKKDREIALKWLQSEAE